MIFSQKDLIGENKHDIHQDYHIIRELGSGSYSVVYEAQHKITKDFRCIKKISKSNFSKDEEESIMNEIQILRETDHPNILRVMEFFQNEKNLFLVMEKLEGGELFNRIIEQKRISERESRSIFRQIMSAVAYLHNKKIIHRDLKPENLMFESMQPDSPIKVIDFGTSRKYSPDEILHAKMGTAYYIAPEVLNKNYDEKCDIWSCGVILYILLCGYPPFNGNCDEVIFQKIQEGRFTFPKEEWSRVSLEAQDLVKRILVTDPNARPSAEEVLSHSWLRSASMHIDPTQQEAILTNLKSFKTVNQLQKAIMFYFVTFYDIKEEKRRLAEIFKSLDKNGDGQLSRDEIISGLKMKGSEDQPLELDSFFKEIDINNTNSIDFSEFIVANYNYKRKINNSRLKELFQLIDSDHDGSITKEELMSFFHFTNLENERMVSEMISEVDSDRNGSISFDEFVRAMQGFEDKQDV